MGIIVNTRTCLRSSDWKNKILSENISLSDEFGLYSDQPLRNCLQKDY